MFTFRKPSRNHTRGIRISSRRTHAKQKTRSRNLPQTTAPSGQRSKSRPPHHNPRQLITLALAVAHHSRRNLEQRVRKHIRAQHPTPLLRRQPRSAPNLLVATCNRKPIQKSESLTSRTAERVYAVALLQARPATFSPSVCTASSGSTVPGTASELGFISWISRTRQPLRQHHHIHPILHLIQ